MEIDKTATGRMELYSRFRIGQTPARAAASHSAQAQNADASRMDTVSVSDEAMLRTEAYRAAMNAPDVRQDKIDALRGRIADGTYRIDSRRIAAGMLGMEKVMLTR